MASRHLLVRLAALAVCALVGSMHASAAVLDQGRTARTGHEFRLGTASAPFAWSTAIADFDRDGLPDFAVVDSVGRTAHGYQYRIEFLVSGGEPYAVAFESPHQALVVAVQDVDRDRHADLVVTSPLVHEVVAIWINDGNGRFRQEDPGSVPPVLPHGASLRALRTGATSAVAVAPGWRDDVVRLTAGVHVPADASALRHRLSPRLERRVLLHSSLAPRAPPAGLR